ncbi:MAG: malonate decarboxylase acyl carrier protein [Deltaproteobacteria bacterium]|nr:MAG: malonate decarboxylase acyl carrier protein [Deltaproteobacteria bacterium]
MSKQLHELTFEFKAEVPRNFTENFLHFGVVGSGDMEVIIEHRELAGAVRVKIVSPVTGYEEVWRRVLERFVNDTGVANASFEINDNNATPVVVSLRLRQALAEIS